MKPSTARDLIALVQAAYPRQPWPAPTVSLYAEELARLPVADKQAVEAIRRLLRSRSSEWPPTIAEILGELIGTADGAPAFAAAWAEMTGSAADGDYFAPDVPPAFSHPAVTELAIAVGWRVFAVSTVGDTYFRHQAEQLYQAVIADRTNRVLAAPEHMAELLAGFAVDVTVALTEPLRELVEQVGEQA